MHNHDFKLFPELSNGQILEFYFDSPHKQITENFRCKVVKVTDGDTIRVKWDDRNFTFPIRLANLASPELDERNGKESQSWLEKEIMGKDVDIILTKTRVERWGRLLAYVLNNGMSMSELSIMNGHGVSWINRNQDIEFKWE